MLTVLYFSDAWILGYSVLSYKRVSEFAISCSKVFGLLLMLVYDNKREVFYDTETGDIQKIVTNIDFKIEDETIDQFCSTLVKVVGFIALTILGITLKEFPPAGLIS